MTKTANTDILKREELSMFDLTDKKHRLQGYGKIIGMQMYDKGIDWVLGPSIDMCFDHLMYLSD